MIEVNIMAGNGISKLKRKEKFISPSKLYVIVTEGDTEVNYFEMIRKQIDSNIYVVCKKGKHPDTDYLIKTANKYLKDHNCNELTHCWIVLDCDVLSDHNVESLKEWRKTNNNSAKQEVGITSPNFEYWLILHFECPKKELTKQQCLTELKKHFPDYRKPFKNCNFNIDQIQNAVKNGSMKEISLGQRKNGTNLHLLLQDLILPSLELIMK